MPWSRGENLYSSPGRLVVKLALGESPEHIPALHDVRSGAQEAATHLDRGRIDQVLGEFTDRFQVARVHSAARSIGKRGQGHEKFDDIEHAIGLSRTVQIEVDTDCALADLIDALRQLVTVEEA